MQKSKLVLLLQEMNPYEQNAFLKFVRSPYINNNNSLISICEYILNCLKDNQLDLLDRHTLWQNNFPNNDFDYDKLRKHFSTLTRMVEQFYAFENLKADDLITSYHTLDRASNLGKKNILTQSVERYQKQYLNKNFFSVKKSLFAYLAEVIVFQEISENSRRYTESNLNRILKLLNAIYYSEFLKQLSYLRLRDWEKENIEPESVAHIRKMVAKNDYEWSNFPGIEIYSRIFQTIENENDDDNFIALRKLISKYNHVFDIKEAKSMYEWVINYCVQKLNKGDTHFLHELFDVYKEFLDSELILEDGQLHDYNFKNIVTTGLRLKEFNWVEYFIDSNASKVPEEQRLNTVAYNKAQLNFYKKNYKEVLALLQEVEYDDLTYNLGAKSMLMATYYELDEIDPLFSLMDSFKVYLNRKQNKIPDNFRILYSNLIKYLKKLTAIPHGDNEKINKFIAEVQKTGNVASINWLLEKANELK
jgi:hypothetical protein